MNRIVVAAFVAASLAVGVANADSLYDTPTGDGGRALATGADNEHSRHSCRDDISIGNLAGPNNLNVPCDRLDAIAQRLRNRAKVLSEQLCQPIMVGSEPIKKCNEGQSLAQTLNEIADQIDSRDAHK